MKVTSKLNYRNIRAINDKIELALKETADATKSNLVESQTMPYDTGELQNRKTFVDDSQKHSGKVSIVSDGPYARRLYYHPEYKFHQDKNPNAGGMWFEPYMSGNKKNFCQNVFKRLLRSKMK